MCIRDRNYTVDEQTALDECIQEIADAPGWLKVFYQDGRHSMQNVFDTCLSNNGFDNTPPNDSNNELEEPEPVIMDGPPQGEALENILSTCVNEAYSSSIAIRFRSANAAEEYLQTSFNDCLNSYTIFEEYSYSEYSYLLNQTPDEPDNNQEESIEDRVDDLEQKFADLFEQLQEILESVEN